MRVAAWADSDDARRRTAKTGSPSKIFEGRLEWMRAVERHLTGGVHSQSLPHVRHAFVTEASVSKAGSEGGRARSAGVGRCYGQDVAEREITVVLRKGCVVGLAGVLSWNSVSHSNNASALSSMDKKTKLSLLKRGVTCLLLVMLYGLFGTLLHAGGASRDATGPSLLQAKGTQPK